jgi:SAM-dependent methyltransferase
MNGQQRLLHFAPELQLTRLLRHSVGEYVTADFMRPRVKLRLDITAIDLPDGSFDVIVAHHILEHVDHHKALAECFRCLKPGGFMVTTTPIIEGWAETYENPAITSRRGRLLHFGQDDHIKFFGRDLRAHMVAAGFDLEEFVSTEPDVARFGLQRGETLFILNKPGDRP